MTKRTGNAFLKYGMKVTAFVIIFAIIFTSAAIVPTKVFAASVQTLSTTLPSSFEFTATLADANGKVNDGCTSKGVTANGKTVFSFEAPVGLYKLTITANAFTSYVDSGFYLGKDTVPETIDLYQGDINADGIINAKDNALVTATFGKRKGKDAEFNALADFNDDGIINAKDKAVLSANFSKRSILTETTKLSLTLSASETEISVSDENKEFYFYAGGNVEYKEVKLYDESKNAIANMVDDGKYSSSGDDLQNDNIFSAKVKLDVSQEKTIRLYSVGVLDNGTEVVSDKIEINVYKKLTSDEIASMVEVDNAIDDKVGSNSFSKLSESEKSKAVSNMLSEQSKEGNIVQESVYYDKENHMYTFSYSCGVLGGVLLKDMSNDENTASNSDDAVSSLEERKDDRYNGSLINSMIESNSVVVNAAADSMETIGKAVVFYAFDDFSSSSRAPFYNDLQNDWNKKGLSTSLDTDVTVADLKTMSDYKVIVIATHGVWYTRRYGFLWSNSESLPTICLLEKCSKSKDKEYSDDLKAKRIIKVNGCYFVRPSFFTNQYSGNKLSNRFVFSESCEFMGRAGTVDSTMAKSFTSVGVDAVAGYHNSVYAVYSRNVMKRYFDQMIEGKTASEALNNAKTTYGSDDVVWAKKNGVTSPHSLAAYPILTGSGAARLVNTNIKNGSFENSSTPDYWGTKGDVRVISKLAGLNPVHGSRMAILTTGIGSMESSYVSGTEGSVLYQTVKIPNNVSSLVFHYDVISEEPMEYVGSKYDDKFIFRIIDSNGNTVVDDIYESVNISNWTSIDGIDFEGGDQTVYHTTWKTAIVDVSAYRGKTVTFQFVVTDVGDSIFDTAALVDNVYLK